MDKQRMRRQAQDHYGSASGPLCLCYSCYLGGFVGLLTMGAGVCLTVLPALGTIFLPLYCLVFCLVLPYLVLSCLIVSHGGLLFSEEETKGQWTRGSFEGWREKKLWSGCISIKTKLKNNLNFFHKVFYFYFTFVLLLKWLHKTIISKSLL